MHELLSTDKIIRKYAEKYELLVLYMEDKSSDRIQRFLKRLIQGEKVRTTKITTSKTKKNIEKVGDDHYIEKIYKSDQNIEIQKIRTSKVTYLWRFAFLT